MPRKIWDGEEEQRELNRFEGWRDWVTNDYGLCMWIVWLVLILSPGWIPWLLFKLAE